MRRTLLRRYNSTATLPTRIQMRVALHVGPVVSDAYGVDGRAIIQPNPGPVDPVVYQQLKCQVKKQAFNAWMYLAQASGEIQPVAANAGQIG